VDQLAQDVEQYLTEVIGQNIKLEQLNSGKLPYYLTRQYAFFQLSVGNFYLPAVILLEEEKFKPAQFLKHMRQAPVSDPEEICVIAHSLPAYVRKRMIEAGISFVIPGVQMYLPRLGMELRRRLSKKKSIVFQRFKPASQVVLIYWLLGKMKEPASPLSLSRQLKYSTMTMSRVLSELAATNIGQVERNGRERLLVFNKERRNVWQESLPMMRNPVLYRKRIKIEHLQKVDLLPAGLSALADRSILNVPEVPEYAISSDIWKMLEQKGIEIIPMEEPGTCMLQIWCYDPFLLKTEGMVDPFSLYLSLQNAMDERIEMALEEMLKQIEW